LKYSEQGFGASAAQLNSSLLTVSVIAILLPAAFNFTANSLSNDETLHDLLSVSHGVALILLFIYGGYLWFQLYSHTSLYDDDGDDVAKSTNYTPRTHRFRHRKNEDVESPVSTSGAIAEAEGKETTSKETTSKEATSKETTSKETTEVEAEEMETPQMTIWVTLGLLVVVTVLVAVTAEWLVDSINGLTDTGHISKEFVGVILLPIVGNAAEHVTAVTVSVKDKLNLSIGVAVGSSIQIALFVIPFIVTLGWILGKPLTLLFDPYQSIAMFLAVLTVNYVVQDGKSNWLEGFILMGLYLILAVTFWYYPGTAALTCT